MNLTIAATVFAHFESPFDRKCGGTKKKKKKKNCIHSKINLKIFIFAECAYAGRVEVKLCQA